MGGVHVGDRHRRGQLSEELLPKCCRPPHHCWLHPDDDCAPHPHLRQGSHAHPRSRHDGPPDHPTCGRLTALLYAVVGVPRQLGVAPIARWGSHRPLLLLRRRRHHCGGCARIPSPDGACAGPSSCGHQRGPAGHPYRQVHVLGGAFRGAHPADPGTKRSQ